MTNVEWKDLIAKEFHVSKNLAGLMYHAMLKALRDNRHGKIGVWRK